MPSLEVSARACMSFLPYTEIVPKQSVSAAMLKLLSQLREKVVIGFVGGSDLAKQEEQLGLGGTDGKNLVNNVPR